MRRVLTWIYAISVVIATITLLGSLFAYMDNKLDMALIFAWICSPTAIIGAFAAVIKMRFFK